MTNEKYRRLSEIERERLTKDQAKELDNYDRRVEREEQHWQEMTLPGSRKTDLIIDSYPRDYAAVETELGQIGDRYDLSRADRALAAAVLAGYTHREIAAATGVTQQAITDRVKRLKPKLRIEIRTKGHGRQRKTDHNEVFEDDQW